MRSSVSVILSSPAPDTSMSHPDYEQTGHDHASLLVLVKHIGSQLKPKHFVRMFERISRVCQERVEDSSGVAHAVTARYIKEYPVENNDWGDFQTHRRLLGLITVGKYDSQQELNELCRLHESLKVKYSSTIFDSRCVLLGYPDPPPYTPPSNFKAAEALWYEDPESCPGMEAQLCSFIHAVFWVLESKRLERGREKIDRVTLLQAPFEKKDFVGLDLESRTNRKRCVGRMTKHLGDLSLQSGLYAEALNYYTSACEVLRSVNDWLWLGGALEGLCATSVVVLFPNLGRGATLQRNASLPEGSPGKQRSSAISTNSLPNGIQPADVQQAQQEMNNLLTPEEVLKRYREAIIHYSKYQNAGIIETEASFKAARIAVEQSCTLQAASFLQNVIFINLPLSEQEKIQRFTSLSDLYCQIGFLRKASFCRRLAATRHVSTQNPQPNWAHCYQLMLQALRGHRLSLDPAELPADGVQGWPVLQVHRSALLLLLALAPLAAAFPMDDYAAEIDSYALARDAAAGEDYFPALAEPAEGEFEYERPPAPLPAIVYFAEAPSLAQAPAGPRPLGPSKLANKVSEGPLAPRRAPPPPPPPPARLVPALVLLLPSRDAAEPARFQQLPAAAQDELPPQPWPYLQAPASRGPAPPFLDAPDAPDAADAPADQEVPVPDTEVRPPPMPESLYAVAAAQSETGSDESHESEESKDAPSPKTSSAEDDAEATPAPPASTLSPPRTRRSPGGGSSASSNSKSSASSSSGGAGASSFSSASSHSSASSGFGEPIFFGGPTNGDSYASSSSQSNAQAGGAGGAGDAAGYGPGFGAGAPSFGAPGAGGYGNYGAGYNPQGGAGAGYGGQGGQGGHAGPAYGGDGNLLNRFGSLDEPAPSSVQHSGTSTGKGVHSSASSSIDSTGKVTYHVQAGKF